VKKTKKTNGPDTSGCPVCGASRDQKERGKYLLYTCGSVYKEIAGDMQATKASTTCLQSRIEQLEGDTQIDLDLIDGAAKEAAMTIKLACDWAAGLTERTEPLEGVIDKLIEYLDRYQGVPDHSEKNEFEWEEMTEGQRRNQWRRDIFSEMGVDMKALDEIDNEVEKRFVKASEKTLGRLASWRKAAKKAKPD